MMTNKGVVDWEEAQDPASKWPCINGFHLPRHKTVLRVYLSRDVAATPEA